MVGEMLSLSEPPREFLDFLVRHSEGNPFFIAEYLRAAVAGGYLRRDGDGHWEIDASVSFSSLALPHSLRDLVARRLDGLSPAARRLCEAAAVLGRVFDGDLPRQVALLADEEMVDALDQIVSRTIFELEDGERLRFQHDKLREIAYSMIENERRLGLHRAAALAIEDRHRDDLAPFYPALAHHFEVGGLNDKALEYLEKSGGRALKTAAYGDAVDAFSRGLKLDIHVPAQRRARLEHGLGKAQFGLGDLAAAEVHARSALEQLGHVLPQSPVRWTLLLLTEAARQAAHRLRLPRLAGRLLRPREQDRRDDLNEAAQAAALITHRYYYIGDSIAMITASLLSVNLAEAAELGWQVPHSYSWLGYIVGLLRQHGLASDYFALAHEGAERRHEPSELAFALTVEAVYHVGFARYREGEGCARRALELVDRGSDPQMLELTLTVLGHIEFYTGRVAEALGRFQALYASATARNNRQHATWALFAQARSLIALERYEDATPLLEDARRALQDKPELDSEIICLGLLALARLKLGEIQGAHRLADETLLRIERSRPIGFSTVDGYDAAAEVFLALGRGPEARRTALALQKLARLFPMAAPVAELRAGEVALGDGQGWRGRRALNKSLQLARKLGMPREAARAVRALQRK
jgi:tetratricopeptide (TPR) repeat protein